VRVTCFLFFSSLCYAQFSILELTRFDSFPLSFLRGHAKGNCGWWYWSRNLGTSRNNAFRTESRYIRRCLLEQRFSFFGTPRFARSTVPGVRNRNHGTGTGTAGTAVNAPLRWRQVERSRRLSAERSRRRLRARRWRPCRR
ncbi:hypothetical protein DFH94DRAFT_706646, partial [Russula ochroleuca]